MAGINLHLSPMRMITLMTLRSSIRWSRGEGFKRRHELSHLRVRRRSMRLDAYAIRVRRRHPNTAHDSRPRLGVEGLLREQASSPPANPAIRWDISSSNITFSIYIHYIYDIESSKEISCNFTWLTVYRARKSLYALRRNEILLLYYQYHHHFGSKSFILCAAEGVFTF